uniref:HDC12662 n=1 Tax=Drosophila melanogaster TaxID=7227 RepID=Q6IKE5_DROME|nr:TPA_inf: HDC12662 [Drosophila melanogaster]
MVVKKEEAELNARLLAESPSTTAHPFVHAPHLDAPVAQFGGAARMWVKLLLRLLLLHHWQSYRKQKWRKEVEKKEVHCTERNSSEVYLALKLSIISNPSGKSGNPATLPRYVHKYSTNF